MDAPAPTPALLPILPELVLALGAMALLMFGVYARHAGSVQLTNRMAGRAADPRRTARALAAAGQGGDLWRQFIVDSFARVHEGPGADRSAAAIAMSRVISVARSRSNSNTRSDPDSRPSA